MGKCTIYINRCGQSAVDFTLVWVAVMLDCSAQNILNIVMAWQCSLQGYKACCDSWSYSSWILYFGWGGVKDDCWDYHEKGHCSACTLMDLHLGCISKVMEKQTSLYLVICCSQWHTHTHSLLRLIHCQNVSGVTFILLLFWNRVQLRHNGQW